MSLTLSLPKITHIPAGYDFAQSLVDGIISSFGRDPITFSRIQIFLPNRRSCRTVSEAFLNATDGKPSILPRLIPIGDLETEDIFLSTQQYKIPIAIPEHRRQFILAQLIMARGDMNLNFGQALHLAQDLAQFIDFVHTHNLDYNTLPDLVQGDLATHWQTTLQFLEIISNVWPKILKEQNLIDKADHRNQTIQAKISSLSNETDILIAAGITASIPTTRAFLKAIYTHTNGCIILPGLDTDIEFSTWKTILDIPHHPQYGLARLLNFLSIKRENIDVWQHLRTHKNLHEQSTVTTITHRNKLSSETHRPAETTASWNGLSRNDFSYALNGLYEIDCENDTEEARTIAVMLRFAAEQKDKTAMLVTPDRDLARQVSQIVKRWNLDIDDSAGISLSQTPVGRYLLLTLNAAITQDNSFTLLSLLKSAFTTLGQNRKTVKDLTSILENTIIRAPQIEIGWDNLLNNIKNNTSIQDEEQRQFLYNFIQDLTHKAAPLFKNTQNSFQEWALRHIGFLESLATSDTKDGADIFWTKDDGTAAADLLGKILHDTQETQDLSLQDYFEGLRTLLDNTVVRPKYRLHPRLQILSPTEARLQTADIVILSGLNEGMWPSITDRNPWMSRPMREKFGMPGIEHMIGLNAHDFSQLFCSPCVYITRAKSVNGAPTVPSRWLQRLKTCLQHKSDHPLQPSNHPFKSWAKEMDNIPITDICSHPRPMPKPPVDRRPKKISATRLEKYISDPYQIYAQKILGLYKLRDIAEPFDRRAWGETVHKVLETFTKKIKTIPYGDEKSQLLEIADNILKQQSISKNRRYYWQKRLTAICHYVSDTIVPQMREARDVYAEHKDSIIIQGITVEGIADRVDVTHDGMLTITDYKTGSLPTKISIKNGISVQLPVLALIAHHPDYKIQSNGPKSMVYQTLKGKDTGTEDVQEFKATDFLDNISKQLSELFTLFSNEAQPYWSRPNPDYQVRFDDYTHLARVKEWSTSDSDHGDGE